MAWHGVLINLVWLAEALLKLMLIDGIVVEELFFNAIISSTNIL